MPDFDTCRIDDQPEDSDEHAHLHTVSRQPYSERLDNGPVQNLLVLLDVHICQTHISLTSVLWDNGKQCRTRSDIA